MIAVVTDLPNRNAGAGTSESEQDISLRKIADGDWYAYQKLFDRYLPRLTYYLRPLSAGSNVDSHDVIQDIFLVVWERRETLYLVKSMDQYLFRMARNRFLDLLRKEQRENKLRERYASIRAATTPTPDDDLLYQQFHEKAVEAIHGLSPKLRDVFLMSHQDDMSLDEISCAMSLPKDTVKKRLWMTNTRIREYLRLYADWLFAFFIIFL